MYVLFYLSSPAYLTVIQSGCDHVYERDEIFITLSLDIRNQNNLRCSLEQHISAELLEEYNVRYWSRNRTMCAMSIHALA